LFAISPPVMLPMRLGLRPFSVGGDVMGEMRFACVVSVLDVIVDSVGSEKASFEDMDSIDGNRVSNDTSPSGIDEAGSGDLRAAVVAAGEVVRGMSNAEKLVWVEEEDCLGPTCEGETLRLDPCRPEKESVNWALG